jgi:hypothetical protein
LCYHDDKDVAIKTRYYVARLCYELYLIEWFYLSIYAFISGTFTPKYLLRDINGQLLSPILLQTAQILEENTEWKTIP